MLVPLSGQQDEVRNDARVSYHLGSTCSRGGPFSLFPSMTGHRGADTDDGWRVQKQHGRDVCRKLVRLLRIPPDTGSDVDGRLCEIISLDQK